jgi:hypothetical protein
MIEMLPRIRMRRTIAVLLALALCSGCSGFQHWAYSNQKGSGSSKKVSAHQNARSTSMMKNSIDSELRREQNHERPPAGKKTWREYWTWRISLWRKDKHKDYEQYLGLRRKELGLPSVKQL